MPDRNNGHLHVGDADPQVKDEEQEVALIVQANAVVYPWTVMIHTEHTAIADRAVMRPRGFDNVAAFAFV